jgi:hypothetical protein
MYDVLRRRTERGPAAAGAALYLWTPVLAHDAGGAVTAYADAPFAMIVLFALTSETPLAVFFLSAGVLLKDEGAAFLLSFALARGLKPIALPAVVAAAWMSLAAFLPRDLDFLPARFLHPDLASVPESLLAIAKEFIRVKHWSLLWGCSLGALIWRARRLDREDARMLVPLAAQIGLYVAVWSTMQPDPRAALLKMEAMRLLLHAAPSFWVWAVWRTASTA